MLINSKKKLGICLGAGGAKGLAHLGVLKALEEENISFDLVAGASIGSIIGGLYANGYSVANMLGLLDGILNNSSQATAFMNLSVYGAEYTIKNIVGNLFFDDLKKPFGCVAVDMDKGEVVKLLSGNLPKAMAASSAILPVIRPIYLDGRYLIDGAYMNAVPADLLKEMGADVIISVNLSGDKNLNVHSKPTLDTMYPDNGVPVCDRLKPMHEFSDVVITPDLKEFNSMSLDSTDVIYERGYAKAKELMPSIKRVLQSNGL